MKSSNRILITDTQLLLLLGLTVTVFHILTNGQYGFHRDELDILMNAHYLDWGYVAYPPLTPFLARIELMLFGPSLIGMRVFPAIGQGVVTVLAGWMARDLGGRRLAQGVAALAVFIGGVSLTAGTLIQYMSFDFVWWVLVLFFTIRMLATEDPRWWLAIGAALGIGLMTKYTIGFLAIGIALSTLLTPTRRYLRSPWLWAGAGLALVIFLPNLIWQIQHQFISLRFLGAIHERDIQWGRTEGFLPEQFLIAANTFTVPLWIAGLIYFLVSPVGKRYRFLAYTYLIVFVLFLVTQGRSYYLSGVYVPLLVGGSVWAEGWIDRLPRGKALAAKSVLWALLVVGGVVFILLGKPVSPINSPVWKTAQSLSDSFAEMIGWPDFVEKVAKIYNALPPEERAKTGILVANYGEAGALELYGPQYGLPKPISGGNSMWARGYGNPPPETVIVIGFQSGGSSRFFEKCQLVGMTSNRYGVKNEESTFSSSIEVCRNPLKSWAEMWKDMQWFQ